MHDHMIRLYGGKEGILNFHLLESALNQPKMALYLLNAPLLEMAASYGFHIAKNHAFYDGNKRTARMAMIVFLRYNNVKIIATEEDTLNMILDVAEGRMSKEQLAEWLETATAPI
jgi:death-on-curing protein